LNTAFVNVTSVFDTCSYYGLLLDANDYYVTIPSYDGFLSVLNSLYWLVYGIKVENTTNSLIYPYILFWLLTSF